MGVAEKMWKVAMYPRVYMTVEPILLVFMFSQFLSYSIFQQFVHSMVCPDCHNQSESNYNCSSMPSTLEREVQEKTSHWILYVNIAFGLPTIFFSLLFGSISDLIGRKPFIFIPALGAAINTVVILEVVYMKDQLPMYMFIIGSFASGLYGGYSVLNSAVYSYASDLTVHSGRTRQISLLESMTYFGATLSMLIGGVWIKRDPSYASPFWCVLACQLMVMLYTVVGLPESMHFSRRHSMGERRPRSIYHLRYSQSLKFSNNCGKFMYAMKKNVLGFFKLIFTNWRLSLLLLTFLFVEINFAGITDIVILYSLGRPLCWKSDTIGYFLASKVFFNGLASLLVLPLLLAMHFNDAIITLIGLVAGAASLVLMGVATKTWMLFLVPVVGSLRGCVVPCIRSMLSKQVPCDKQGILFSSTAVIESTCTLLASLIYNSIYPLTSRIHPGMCFFIMAAALALPFTFIIIMQLTRKMWCNSCRTGGEEVPIEREPLLQ